MSGSNITAFIGDSLTEGGRWQEWLPDETVANHGVGGDTTDDLLERLPEIIAEQPTTVVLLIGTNDLAWRHSVEHIVRNIETVLVTLRRELPDAQILVQSVMPREAEWAESIRDINRHLWQFAPTVRAQYLDLWPALALDDGTLHPEYSDDSLHLNDAGYRVWLSELQPALEVLRGLPPTSRAILLPKGLASRS
ncbi:GDSL-type esterase/lipase family protein [Microbacterium sp. STN6]|uniref:GDSL-type esterase/lipase family protein n=1 Tax=Microbacterium sp. STN6 TaxID=2995588 RepID=UPI002260B00C|nr:GDSL-type esterase/lipase family protein [Microbacterium sp. STN6]MCX7521233.1 GDSL-type esterase/lipase family protein [Microbacterium sp. STN6]